MVGIATKNENSAAAVRLRPAAMPPMIVAPERGHPGTSARLWQTPTANARGSGVSSARSTTGAVCRLSSSNITTPPTMNAMAHTRGL